MKTIRKNAYETSSSSSHSLCIATGDLTIPNVTSLLLRKGEFGWERDEHSDFGTKLRYSYTLSKGSVSDHYLEMLKEVLHEYIPTLETIEEDEESWGYVDHQSFDLIDEVFESKQSLASFLFCGGSSIETGNDNDEY